MNRFFTVVLSLAIFLLGAISSPLYAQSWLQTNFPLGSGNDVVALAVSPNGAGGTNLFAGVSGINEVPGGLFLSTNNGASWTEIDTGLTNTRINALAVSGTNLFAGTWNGLFLSTNNGTSWVNLGLPYTDVYSNTYIAALAVSPNGSGGTNLFAGTDGGGIFLSTDNGANWNAANSGLTETAVLSFAVSPNGSGGANIFAGTTWQNGGAFLSTNNGASWTRVDSGLIANVQCFAVSPAGSGDTDLFAGTYGYGVFVSTNNGTSWSAVNSGLSNSNVLSLAVSPNGSGGTNLFAGTYGGGVYLSTNNGASWTAVNSGLTTSYVGSLAVSGTNLFAGTDAGVWKYYLVNVCVYLGGSPTADSSWSCGHVPVYTDTLSFDSTATLNQFPVDSVGGFSAGNEASITFTTNDTLKVSGPFIINDSSAVSFGGSNTGKFVLYDSWLNYGVFNPGNSTVIFKGNNKKIIGGSEYSGPISADKSKMIAGVHRQNNRKIAGQIPNTFYDLSIEGSNANSRGNIAVQNLLQLDSSLTAQSVDTLIILSSDSGAIAGSGKIPTGDVRRSIQPGSTSRYRFESVGSFVQFQSGTNPTTVTEAALPESATTRSLGLWWEVIPTTVNTVNHTLSAANLNHFSSWAVYKPGGGLSKVASGGIGYVHLDTSLINPGDRLYRVLPSVEGTFVGTVSFSYVDTELSTNPMLDSLVCGPFVIDSVQQGWNMVSLPVTPETDVKDSLFPGNISISNAFSYSGGYVSNGTMQPGIGYWLKFGTPQLVSMLGFDADTELISLVAGWNMIGTISYAADTSGITTYPPGELTSSFFGYQKGYYMTTTLLPMRGYWVKTLAACQMRIAALPLGEKNVPKVSAVPAELKGFTQLMMKGSDGQSQTLFVGGSTTLNASRYEMPPLAPKGIFDARFANNSMVMVSPSRAFTETAMQFSSASYPVTIQWQPVNSTNGVVIVGGKEYSLASAGSAIVNNAQTSVSVKLGPAVVLPTKPKAFALYQNYPNPFNPMTTIRFDLPQDATVTLKLYNVLGQEVMTLISNQPYTAGSYAQQFRLDKFSSGVYMYRISAGKYSAVRKMLLMK